MPNPHPSATAGSPTDRSSTGATVRPSTGVAIPSASAAGQRAKTDQTAAACALIASGPATASQVAPAAHDAAAQQDAAAPPDATAPHETAAPDDAAGPSTWPQPRPFSAQPQPRGLFAQPQPRGVDVAAAGSETRREAPPPPPQTPRSTRTRSWHAALPWAQPVGC